MSRERLEEIEARAKAATRGPWRVRASSVRTGESQTVAWDIAQRSDRDFIAHAREDVPWLVAQVRERDAEIARLRDALTEALDGWADAAQYKGDHLREKHGDAEGIARLRALLTKEAPDA